MTSLLPDWMLELPLQQQAVLLLAARGPDGIAKSHPCKDIQRAYRGSVMRAGRFGRMLRWGEKADSFMGMDLIANEVLWTAAVKQFFHEVDSLPHHFTAHLAHGAQVLGYKHPEYMARIRWLGFYLAWCEDLHVRPELERDMDTRLSDWDQAEWPQ